MSDTYNQERQFTLTPKDFLKKLDFLNWYRFFFILKELARLEPKTILEVGPGEGTIKRVFQPFVERYAVIDVNSKLAPDFLGDIRTTFKEAEGKFECLIAADILEHIPFEDLPKAAQNIFSYLTPGGYALVTIPHRAWFLFWMGWLTYTHHVWRAPEWLRNLTQRARGRRENPIDPDHEWEIGDGRHSIEDVEKVFKDASFKIEKRVGLLYVDFWVLKK
ncbi:MAG: methyltransferase domain-containing protein [bacterium]|nr:methyltransferase domain-containing protein [bacterium]